MSQIRLPEGKDPVGDLCNLTIVPEIVPEHVEMVVNQVIEKAVDSNAVFGKNLTKKDEIINNVPLPVEAPTGQGKRGKDKVKRKKKVMSQAQLDALALGREKSRAKRSAKKEKKKQVMDKPAPNPQMDYQTFSNYMNMYEDNKKTKHSTSKQPHPNRIINERLRPLPPKSLPRDRRVMRQESVVPKAEPPPKRVMKWQGTAASYQSNKRYGGGRWNF
mgnify:FL=1